MANASTTKTIRLLHRYLGLFFAPAIVFFSFSGALQTFSLHEVSRDSSYQPPIWVVRMAQLHKKQTFIVPPVKAKVKTESIADSAPISAKKVDVAENKVDEGAKKSGNDTSKFALKWFVFIMSIALMLSTVLGVVMALRYGGDARLVWAMIAFGTLFPLAVAVL